METKMEQVVTERTLAQEQQLSQPAKLYNGAMDKNGPHLPQDLPQRRYPGRWTGWDQNNFSSRTTNGENLKEYQGGRPICRDNIRGKCARGSSCKYLHDDRASHDEARFCRNERRDLDTVADTRYYPSNAENKDADLHKRSFFAGHRSKSPCRKFQSGSCHRGSSCPYLHSGCTKYERSTYWNAKEHHGLGGYPGSHEGNLDNNVDNKDGDLQKKSLSTEHRSRSPCRKFQSGSCYRGSSCPYLHIGCAKYERPTYLNPKEHHGVGGNPVSQEGNLDNHNKMLQGHDVANRENSLRLSSFSSEHRSRSPCRNFLRGRCHLGASCRRLHPVDEYKRNWSEEQQPRIAAARDPSFGGRRMDISSREDSETNHCDHYRNGSFPGESRGRLVCQYFLRGSCNRGTSCDYLHPVTGYENTRYDLGARHHQGGTATSRYHRFDERNTVGVESCRMEPCQDQLVGGNVAPHDVNCNEHHKPRLANEQLTYDRGISNVTSRRRSSERTSSRDVSDVGHGKLRPEVCLRFTKGRCDQGEHCRYVHSFHEYVSCNANEHHKPQVANEQLTYDRGISIVTSRRWSSERPSSRDVSDVGHDKLRPEVCLRFTRGRCDQGEHCRYLHSFHEYASSDSKQSKRLQSENSADLRSIGGENSSATPLVPREQYTSGNEKMSTSELKCTYRTRASTYGSFGEEAKGQPVNDAMKVNADQKGEELAIVGRDCETSDDGDEDVKLWTRPLKRLQSRSQSPFSPENDIRCRKLRRDSSQGENPSHGMPLDQCPRGSLHASSAIPSKTNTNESAANTLQPIGTNQNDAGLSTDTMVSEVSRTTHQESDLKSAAEEHLISPVNSTIVLEKDEIGGGIVDVSDEGNKSVETIKALKTYSRKKKSNDQPSSSQCCLEPLSEEFSDASSEMQPSSSSVKGTSLDHPGIAPVSGATDDLNTRDAKSNVPTKLLVNEQPLRRKRNREIIIEGQDDVVDSSSAGTELGTLMVGNTDISPSPSLKHSNAARPISKRKLLVLDVNGLLADIVGDFPDKYKPDITVSGKGVFKRPFCDDFLQFCFEKFDVGIWSSRTRKNVNMVVDFLLKNTKNKLLFCWDQSHCTETGYKTVENQDKPLVLKELKKLWENRVNNLPWKKGFYNETNTVLLDDSPYKALRNPPCTAVFPFPYSFMDEKDDSLGPDGELRLYLERLAESENVQKFIQENPFGQRPITKANLSWAFYSKIVGTYASQQEGNASKSPDS